MHQLLEQCHKLVKERQELLDVISPLREQCIQAIAREHEFHGRRLDGAEDQLIDVSDRPKRFTDAQEESDDDEVAKARPHPLANALTMHTDLDSVEGGLAAP